MPRQKATLRPVSRTAEYPPDRDMSEGWRLRTPFCISAHCEPMPLDIGFRCLKTIARFRGLRTRDRRSPANLSAFDVHRWDAPRVLKVPELSSVWSQSCVSRSRHHQERASSSLYSRMWVGYHREESSSLASDAAGEGA